MRVNRIFELSKGSLYSVRFEGEGMHAFEKAMHEWQDAEFLKCYFKEYQTDFAHFWPELDLQEAILSTSEEATRMKVKLLEVARMGKRNIYPNLSDLFRPLYAAPMKIERFEKSKWNPGYKRWLRLYAVRISAHCYIITGGAIKLTRPMNEREELLIELAKLECVCHYLRAEWDSELDLVELL